ncbi:non-ribosomal peptide synthetase [Kiloniella laminariae]|uniref:non-ribosomal peptide synthetase n=1 Tax=Kiloniella laminariae TaxID=454162 RepID=UPI000377DDBD|nr:non-ribosomal peptide synthetase [Kiloniella laminariae]
MISLELQRLIRDNSIDVYLKDDQLAVRWHKGEVNHEILPILKENKSQLIAWLSENSNPDTTQGRAPTAHHLTTALASHSQQSLWTLNEIEAKGLHYTLPMLADLSGPLDREALSLALETIVQRHETLRSVFHITDDQLYQTLLENYRFVLDYSDLSGEQDLGTELAVIENSIFDLPFDLAKGPLFRGHLVKTAHNSHKLYLAGHHIVMDGWSFGVLSKELAELYKSRVTDQASSLEDLSHQFSDFSLWQQQQEASAETARHHRFWRKNLEGAPVVHSLPLDHPRKSHQGFEGDTVERPLPPECVTALQDLAKTHKTTLFTVFYAAFTALLARHSNENDIVLGAPVANRERTEFSKLIGFFANVLPLRAKVDPEQVFGDFIDQCHQNIFTAFDHQDTSFDRIVEQVNPPRNLSHSSIFQIMIAMENFVADSFTMHDVTLTLELPENISAKHDLALAIRHLPEGLSLNWTYATELFDRETVETLSEHFSILLLAIAADPQSTISDLPMMSEQENRELLKLSVGPKVPYDQTEYCHKLFESFVSSQPDHVAVRDSTGEITYGDLNSRADKIAALLSSRAGKQPGYIGIALDRSIDFICAQLAVLKSGNIFIPIDPSSPGKRVADIAEDTGFRLLISRNDLLADKDLVLEGIENLDITDLTNQPVSDSAPSAAMLTPGDAAYVVFTSGSTGRPKGAIASHRGFINMTLSQRDRFDMTPETVMTVSANVSFDSVLWEIWPTLTSGGCLVMTPDATLKDPLKLSEHLQQHQPSHFWLPTGLMETICSIDFNWPASIRHAFTGGDRLTKYCLPPELKASLVNIYGPSECSVWATCHEVTPQDPSPTPIGKPLYNVSTFIMDDKARLLPRGAVGEIYVGGDGVGLGYVNRPDLNEKSFIANPCDVKGHERLYRTGDLGRWLKDGTIDCLGRIDTQVKIRGFRIELSEITAHLLAQSEVVNAFVHVTEKSGDKQLVAFVVPQNPEQKNALVGDLRRHLGHVLPNYMIPSIFCILDALPLTANGKVDRRQLDTVLAEQGDTNQVNTASPRDQIELALYKIWQRILLHNKIGIRDNFFDIGGSSIAAIKVMSAINAQMETQLNVGDLLRATTIEEVAELIRSGRANRGEHSRIIDLKNGKKDRNIICVHPAGGTAFCYLSLAKLLPDELGVFGLQARGVYPGETFLPDISTMARHHIESIEHLLDGPTVLVGASFGGLLGYEMVRILHERGITNTSVVMLDTEGTEDPEILKLINPVSAEIFREKLVRYNGMYPGIDDAQISQYHQIYNHHLVSQRSFKAQTSKGRCLLVQATDDTSAEERAYGQEYWRKYAAGDLVFETSPGDHATMLEAPAVQHIAKILEKEITRDFT